MRAAVGADGGLDLRAFPVVVVDDEPDNLDAFRFTFRKSFVLHTAAGAQEALALLREVDAAVIVTDQRMPGMTVDASKGRLSSRKDIGNVQERSAKRPIGTPFPEPDCPSKGSRAEITTVDRLKLMTPTRNAKRALCFTPGSAVNKEVTKPRRLRLCTSMASSKSFTTKISTAGPTICSLVR